MAVKYMMDDGSELIANTTRMDPTLFEPFRLPHEEDKKVAARHLKTIIAEQVKNMKRQNEIAKARNDERRKQRIALVMNKVAALKPAFKALAERNKTEGKNQKLYFYPQLGRRK